MLNLLYIYKVFTIYRVFHVTRLLKSYLYTKLHPGDVISLQSVASNFEKKLISLQRLRTIEFGYNLDTLRVTRIN